MLIVLPVIFAAIAVLLIILRKAYEIRSDNERIARGEKPKYNNPPVYDVIDWTRRG